MIHPVALDLADAQETAGQDPFALQNNDVAGTQTFADPNAVVMWTSGVQMSIIADVNLKTFIGKGSGGTFQMGFAGPGWVMIQPSEASPISGGKRIGTGL